MFDILHLVFFTCLYLSALFSVSLTVRGPLTVKMDVQIDTHHTQKPTQTASPVHEIWEAESVLLWLPKTTRQWRWSWGKLLATQPEHWPDKVQSILSNGNKRVTIKVVRLLGAFPSRDRGWVRPRTDRIHNFLFVICGFGKWDGYCCQIAGQRIKVLLCLSKCWWKWAVHVWFCSVRLNEA